MANSQREAIAGQEQSVSSLLPASGLQPTPFGQKSKADDAVEDSDIDISDDDGLDDKIDGGSEIEEDWGLWD